MKIIMFAFTLTILVSACKNSTENSASPTVNTSDTSAMATKPAHAVAVYTADMLDSKKDLVCGMPVSAGIADTAHYKGKVYGFCAEECKDEFEKAPESFLTAKQ